METPEQILPGIWVLPRKQGLVGIDLRWGVGARHDPVGRSGAAHLFEHLMFAGTPRHRRGELIRRIEAWGGVANAVTTADDTRYHVVIPAPFAMAAVELLRDMFVETIPALSGQALTLEQDIVVRERAETVDSNPRRLSDERATAALVAAGSAYERPVVGRPSEVRAMSLADCHRFFVERYQARSLAVAAVGAIPDGLTEALLAIRTDAASRSDQSSDLAVPRAATRTGVTRMRHCTSGRPRLTLAVPLTLATENGHAADWVAAQFLGRGGDGSLVEALAPLGVADSAFRIMTRRHGPSIGLATFDLRHTTQAQAVLGTFARHVRTIAVEGAAAEQAQRARRLIALRHLREIDAVSSCAAALTNEVLCGRHPAASLTRPEEVLGLTDADLTEAVSRWWPTDRVEVVEG